MPACQAGVRGFESLSRRHFIRGGVALTGEQLACTEKVAGFESRLLHQHHNSAAPNRPWRALSERRARSGGTSTCRPGGTGYAAGLEPVARKGLGVRFPRAVPNHRPCVISARSRPAPAWNEPSCRPLVQLVEASGSSPECSQFESAEGDHSFTGP